MDSESEDFSDLSLASPGKKKAGLASPFACHAEGDGGLLLAVNGWFDVTPGGARTMVSVIECFSGLMGFGRYIFALVLDTVLEYTVAFKNLLMLGYLRGF